MKRDEAVTISNTIILTAIKPYQHLQLPLGCSKHSPKGIMPIMNEWRQQQQERYNNKETQVKNE